MKFSTNLREKLLICFKFVVILLKKDGRKYNFNL